MTIVGNRNHLRRILQSFGAGFDPAKVPGLLGWYKADTGTFQDTTGTTPAGNGDPVGNWKGKGKGNLKAAANDGTRPTKGSGKNSQPTICFDGLDDFMSETFTPPLEQPYTIYMVFDVNSTADGETFLDGTGVDVGKFYNNNGFFAMASDVNLFDSFIHQDFYVAELVFNGVNSKMVINGVTYEGDTGVDTTPNGIAVGAKGNKTNFSDICVYEMIVYNEPVSDQNSQNIIAYLDAEYDEGTVPTLWSYEILHEETLGVAGNFDISGISQDYKHLLILTMLRDTTATVEGYIFANNDTTVTNYHMQRFVQSAINGKNGIEYADPRFFYVNNTAPANSFEYTEFWIPWYADSGEQKLMTWKRANTNESAGGANGAHEENIITWKNTGAINRITIQPTNYPTGNFDVNSYLMLLGVGQ